MSLPELKLHVCEESGTAGGRGRARTLGVASLWLSAALLTAVTFAAHALPARAQTQPARAQAAPTPNPPGVCPPEMMPGQFLFKVPEIAANGNRLRGTILLSDEDEWMAFRRPVSAPSDSSTSQCFEQHVRIFRGFDTTQYVTVNGKVVLQPYAPKPMAGGLALPMPGPTLRARVGDLVQLTFINQINPSNFIESIDRGETGEGGGCDSTTSGYPGNDKFPDCFHGSSTGNIHFHGTHTNPNTTGDNVFIEVRPSPRDSNNKPVVTPESVKLSFNDFFTRCEQQLGFGPSTGSMLKEWPTSWKRDMPTGWQNSQMTLLQQYDAKLKSDYPNNNVSQLWPVNAAQIAMGAWPQYYIGSFPYCYRLPVGPPNPPPPGPPAAGTAGKGTAETGHAGMNMGGGATTAQPQSAGTQVRMGQAPGTHWYHAHKHGSTAINVANGMTGAFIIEGQYDDDLNTFYGANWTRTQPVMVINQLGASPNLMRGSGGRIDKGPDFSVNGRLKPVVKMLPGEVQMWRVINTSGRAGAKFMPQPAGGLQWKQLAQDGVQFSNDNYKNRTFDNVLLASGNRADILVKAPTAPGSYPVIVKNMVDPADLASANPLTLLTVKVDGQAATTNPGWGQFITKAPTFPGFLDSIGDDEVKATKRLVFKTTAPGRNNKQMIDGKQFDGEVGQVVLLNTVEEWKIENDSIEATVSHPFHIHINPFQVTSVFDPNEQVSVTVPDLNNPGQTMTLTAARYPFSQSDIATNAALAKLQCPLLDPYKPDTWTLCFPGQTYQGQAPPTDMDNIWWDTFPIPSGRQLQAPVLDAKGNPVIDPVTNKPQQVRVPGYFKMRSRFVDFPGFYVIHCHILAHEDRGMMTIVEVAPTRTPYSHH
jgi:FtsP/CotA-like multicopper oxidase with cupredoxin domain